ncbi:bifunctional N-acetylglucosamine-1-phosphate-uridyltransferase/glucosamine-1-phosphate-acetyltransferase GlmU-like protein [Flavobacterium sp. 2755]|uniref:LpxA family transferase n=1 Tax=Flavobacterium sp. 2755 TaxID=2817765 RepID=UPI002867A2FC|nr:LpxA family transferase [Flavobacterium sp. 2755]MDR6764574.1 bifunctional N-acetylglucosamine-1-phosphate-uridyltransferase/glucosamine-1-phosphate-acetyltransferase GlmU-like protein [Flavobacterium sp. 2755]
MIKPIDFIGNFDFYFPDYTATEPWNIVNELDKILLEKLKLLSADYRIEGTTAIHKTAVIEEGVTLKGTIIISENCYVGAHAYLRGPILFGKSVKIGPGSEIKQSFISDNSAVAHFNYIGNSLIGQNINFEAGSICANHYNERKNKNISVKYKEKIINTHSDKFGSLLGDNSKVGANAVLSPGTILDKNMVVKRLQLIEQLVEE